MNIVFAASEAAPYIKSGGLGDVASALPRALSKIKGAEVCVFLPYYRAIKNNPAFDIEFITSFNVPLAWRNTYAGVFKAVIKNTGVGKNKRNDLIYYFIDNDYYFNREGLYGHPDDGERFAFFSKAVLESLQYLDLTPDVIHCNDWQTGFIPLFLKALYNDIPRYQGIKTVFTIHNIEYQGKADPDFVPVVLGVSKEWEGALMFDKLVNAMKCAIVLADKVTTVSKTYSYEIRYAYFAHGLHNILNENAHKLTGIVNGIDTDLYNAATNPDLPAHYKPGDLAGKAQCKEALQRRLGLEVNPDIPIVAMITRLVAHKGMDLVEFIGEEMVNTLPVQFVVLGTGDRRYEDYLNYLAYNYQGKVSAVIAFDGTLSNQIYAGADLFLMPSKSEPCGLSQLIAMRYGTVPIVRETGGLVDTVPPIDMNTLEGRGITFKVFNAHDMLGAVRRGVDLFYDKEKYQKVVNNIMRYDSSWKKPAEEYMQVYSEITGR